MNAQIKHAPSFPQLVEAHERFVAANGRRGGRSLIVALSQRCFQLEQAVMRETGEPFMEVNRVLLGVAHPPRLN